MDRLKLGAADVPVQLLEGQGEINGRDHTRLEQLRLLVGFVEGWVDHVITPFPLIPCPYSESF